MCTLFVIGNALDSVSGIFIGLTVLAAVVVILRMSAFPHWLGWLGLISGGLGVLGAFAADRPDQPVGVAGFIGIISHTHLAGLHERVHAASDDIGVILARR